MELVVYIQNEQDLIVLEPLLKRMKLRFERKNGKKESTQQAKLDLSAQQRLEAARVLLLQMHEEGIDVSTYGDPIEWQRETRNDPAQPFRD